VKLMKNSYYLPGSGSWGQMEKKKVIPLKEGNKKGNINDTQGMQATITSHHPTPLTNYIPHGADTATIQL
jgi:hypothetical protein